MKTDLLPLNRITLTVKQTLELPHLSKELKNALSEHPEDWCVLITTTNGIKGVSICPPQSFEVPTITFSPEKL